jgi:protein-S-isoprenylcysteine O-methyltransferase Ste14
VWEKQVIRERYPWRDFVPVTVVSVLFVSQIIVGVYLLLSGASQIEVLAFAGAGLYVFSGLVFGWLPTREFRKEGGVREGKSYIHTTQLVDSGIYSIVRHPQYVTFMLWAVAGMLLFQHWVIVLLGIPIFPLTYGDLIKADRNAIEKFGDDYRVYMTRVPRMNFLIGVLRQLRRRRD